MKNLQLIIHIVAAIISTFIYYVILSIAFMVLNIHWLVSLKVSAALVCSFVDYLDVKGGD